MKLKKLKMKPLYVMQELMFLIIKLKIFWLKNLELLEEKKLKSF